LPSEDLEYRLSELAARLAHVERRLGIARPAEQPPLPVQSQEVAAIVPPPLPEAPPPEVIVPPPLPAQVPLHPPTTPPPIAPWRPLLGAETTRDHPPIAAPSGVRGRAVESRGSKARGASLESLIGGRWFMVAGALVVVVAIGLALQHAYKQGWLGLVTPGMRCLVAAGFGAVLLVLGEVARRKINAAASAGLSGAGVAVMYAAAYAAYGPFHLIGAAPAFVLLAAVSAVGIAVAVRAGLASVAAVSIVGAYITPLLLSDAPSAPMVLPAYLLAILSVGLWLSAWRRAPFRVLRPLVWWGTMLYGGAWALAGGGLAEPVVALTFLALVWGAVHAELAFSARRGAIGVAPAPASGRVVYQIIRPLLTSFSTSAWAAGLGVIIVESGRVALPDWFPPAGGTVAAGGLAAVLAGNLRVLRDRPRDDAERLGAALAMQAGALLIAAVALGLGDWLEVVAWLGLGLGAIGAGRWIGARALTVYGLIVLGIGTARLLLVDWWFGGLTGSGVDFAWVHLTRWTGLVGAAGAAWLGAAWLIRAGGEGLSDELLEADAAHERRQARAWWPIGHACIGIGLALLGISLIHERSLPTPVAIVFAGLAVGASLMARRVRSEGLLVYGVLLLCAATAWMGIADWRLLAENSRTVHIGGLVLTRWSIGMVLTSLAWFASWRLVRARAAENGVQWVPLAPALLAVAISVLFASLLHPSGSSGSESVVGLALGLALVWVARQAGSPAMALYSFVVLGLVTAWLAFFEWATAGAAASERAAGGLVLSRWTGLMALAGAAWIVAGRAGGQRLGDAAAVVRMVTTGVGLAMLLASLLHGNAEPAWVCGAWLVLSAGVLAANRLDPTLGLDRMGLAALMLTLAAWVAAFPMRGWFAWQSIPGLHPGLLMAGAMVAVAGGAWRFRRVLRATFAPAEVLGAALAIGAISLVFAATSLEVARVAGDWASDERARKAAVSIWWGLFAIAMVAGGFWKRWPVLRYVGLGLLAVATAKALIYDLGDLTPPWRVASLLGLGLLMMGVALGYSRAAQRFERASRAEDA
jgi:hypothetical protein